MESTAKEQADEPTFWAGPAALLLARLDARTTGLSAAEVAQRLVAFGPNDPATVKRTPGWLRFAARLGNPLVIVLLLASGLSAIAGDTSSFIIITVIVTLSMVLDFFQESRAQNAIEALRRSAAVHTNARRDGAAATVPVDQIVPGDVVELIAGDLIPADGRILESRELYVNQALLTGEPYPAEKHPAETMTGSEDPVSAINAVFAGTSVVSGTATVLVCRTGKQTSLAHLAKSLTEKPPATEFERDVRRFGMLIVRFTILLVLLALVVNVASHRAVLESLLFALALAVGLTPELLPMILTVTLARAAINLAKRKVIVKRLAAIHDIGAMDVLCTDKTGTLTEARIELVHTIDGFGNPSEQTLVYAWLNSRFESGMKSPLDEAILAARAPEVASWQKLDEVPFDFERRRVSVLVEHEGERWLVVKGAPEDVLRLSEHYEDATNRAVPLDVETRRAFAGTFASLGKEGYRALGVATRVVGPDHRVASVEDEAGLVFAGYAVFLDPPKASAGATIKALRADGVTVKLLTGDTEQVARHVLNEINVEATGVLTGDALAHLPEEALIGQLRRTNLFCRVTPQQKLRILLGLKRMGYVVGFLGDGINDAPALHASDVGISVDGAAEVARQAADLILLEHELSVVHQAILQGRATVRNVTKYILMGSSSNFGNMVSMAGAALFLPFLPMLPIQVLLNNLLYDLSQTAIPFDNVDKEATERPAHWDLRLIQRFMLLFGPISSLFDFLTFYALLYMLGAGERLFQTGWFVESLATQVFVILAIRTKRPLFRSAPHPLLAGMACGVVALALLLPFTAPGRWFGFVPLPGTFFLYLLAAILAYLGLVEGAKRAFYGVAEA